MASRSRRRCTPLDPVEAMQLRTNGRLPHCRWFCIGADTTIFTLIDAVLLKMLPVKNPQSLMLLRWAVPGWRSIFDPTLPDGRNSLGSSRSGSPPRTHSSAGQGQESFEWLSVWAKRANASTPTGAAPCFP
jgi:hypothetical protein